MFTLSMRTLGRDQEPGPRLSKYPTHFSSWGNFTKMQITHLQPQKTSSGQETSRTGNILTKHLEQPLNNWNESKKESCARQSSLLSSIKYTPWCLAQISVICGKENYWKHRAIKLVPNDPRPHVQDGLSGWCPARLIPQRPPGMLPCESNQALKVQPTVIPEG